MKALSFITLLLLSSCSLSEMDHNFITTARGEYDLFLPIVGFPTTTTIDKNGNFVVNSTHYFLDEAISPSTAIYKVDDVSYSGIIIDDKGNLLEKPSTTGSRNDIPDLTTTADSRLLATRVVPPTP